MGERGAASNDALIGGIFSDSHHSGHSGGPISTSTVSGASPHIGRVFVLGATNRVSALDPALRRPGRFDREVEVGIPSGAARGAILLACLARFPCELDAIQIAGIAARMHGYVGADIAALCREAAAAALRRVVADKPPAPLIPVVDVEPRADIGVTTAEKPASTPSSGSNHFNNKAPDTPTLRNVSGIITTSTSSGSGRLAITAPDMETALRTVQPSALREIAVEVPAVAWSSIGGQEDVKQLLREAVEWPLTHPLAFVRMGILPPKGVLMYGPPGE